MMETMIPPQVGMRLRTKKREAKRAQQKKRKKGKKREKNEMREKERRGNVTILSTLVLQSSTMFFI